jgi:hypothetical protein
MIVLNRMASEGLEMLAPAPDFFVVVVADEAAEAVDETPKHLSDSPGLKTDVTWPLPSCDVVKAVAAHAVGRSW